MATYGISTYGTAIGITGDDIKNLALFELGFPDSVDFTDLTLDVVQKVNRIYPTCLLFVLSNYPWRFSLKRIELTNPTLAGDDRKYKYNYILPANLLAVKNGYTDAGYACVIRDFESTPVEFNTDSNKVYLWYISIVDEEDFPQYFIDYFKYKLALDLCFNFTGDTDLLKLLAAQEQAMLVTAKNIDAKQVQTRIIKASPFTAIRR